jgi:ketosteroid isomerase-like protein
MILSWLAKKLVSRAMARNRRGDLSLTLALDAPDVTLTFPGDNSWSGTFRGKAAVKRWLERMVQVRLQTFPDEVVAVGPPWNTTMCIRGHDYLKSPEGETVYENRFVIWGKLRWGRLKEYEVYEDTIRPRALDEWLAANEQRLLSASAS